MNCLYQLLGVLYYAQVYHGWQFLGSMGYIRCVLLSVMLESGVKVRPVGAGSQQFEGFSSGMDDYSSGFGVIAEPSQQLIDLDSNDSWVCACFLSCSRVQFTTMFCCAFRPHMQC